MPQDVQLFGQLLLGFAGNGFSFGFGHSILHAKGGR
jgi:hypothetical protein